MNKKGFISPQIFILILGIVVIGAGSLYIINKVNPNVLSYRTAQTLPNQLISSPTPNSLEVLDTVVEVTAWGTIVRGEGPKIALEVNGKQEVIWKVTKKKTTYKFVKIDASLKPEDIRVRFINDYTDPVSKASRNVKIDFITINGVRYDSEDASTYSTGTWSIGSDGNGSCAPGFKKSAWLHCNGYFQYASKVSSEFPDSLAVTRLEDSRGLQSQTFTPNDVKFKGKAARGYVFRVEKNKPYKVHIVDYYKKYGTNEYIETYLFDSSKSFVMEAQTNLNIREGVADVRKVYSGLPVDYEGDVYIIVTNKFNDERSFDIYASNTLNTEPVLKFRSFTDSKVYNLSELTEFNRKFALFVNQGALVLDLKGSANALSLTSFPDIYNLKVYTLPGTYQEHIQQYIEDGTYDYKYAKNDGVEIPVTVVRTSPSTLEIYATNKNSVFAQPLELPNRSQVQVYHSFKGAGTAEYDDSFFFWVE